MPDELLALMKRFNQIGTMLPPRDDDLNAMDESELGDVRLLYAELRSIQAQIDRFLIQRGLKPWFASRTSS